MPTNTPNSAIVRSGKLPLMNKWLCYQQLNISSERQKSGKFQATSRFLMSSTRSKCFPVDCNISCRCSRSHAATPASMRLVSASCFMALASLSKTAARLSAATSKCSRSSSDAPMKYVIGITQTSRCGESELYYPNSFLSSTDNKNVSTIRSSNEEAA